MRKLWPLLLTFTLLLSGCTNTAQVEELAFAEILGIDMKADNQIEVSIEVPKISGKRGESENGRTSNLVYSASGSNFDKALNLLQWTVPRRLDLSQIKLIVVSESLARSERFGQVSDTIMATPRLYTAARLAVCSNSAKEFIAAEEPVIGTRLSAELTATFEDYIRNGYIPDETFADMYYKSKSVYSDPLAIYAESAPKSEPTPSNSGDSEPAAAILPSNPQQPNVEMQHSNRFLGAVIFRNGIMAGRLTGEEFLYCKMLRGESQTFPFALKDQTVGLTTMGTPDIRINLQSEPMQIDILLRFSIVSSSRNAPVNQLESALHAAFMHTIDTCRTMGTEPFDFSGRAASSFLTFDQWQQFDWLQHFLNSNINLNILVHNAAQ